MTLSFDDGRSTWGAAPNRNPRRVPFSARIGISWHWAGPAVGLLSKPHSACLHQTKSWQAFHQGSRRGWSDIGYNLLICPHGRVIEGRGTEYQGAHSPGVNYQHFGVQFMVGGNEKVTPLMFERAVQLRADLEDLAGKRLRQWGHRDDKVAHTECPGDQVEAWVKDGGAYKTGPTQGGGQSAPIHVQPKPSTPEPYRIKVRVSNLQARSQNGPDGDVIQYNRAAWHAIEVENPAWAKAHEAAWMAEPENVFGWQTAEVTYALYENLQRKYPKSDVWGTLPTHSKSDWATPGPKLLEALGFDVLDA